MAKDATPAIKHYEVRISLRTREDADKVILALNWAGYETYISCETFDGETNKFIVCYNAQPDEVEAVHEAY